MRDFIPREPQVLMIDHALNTARCALFAGMGTGKTGATLSVLDTVELAEPGPSLVLAPLRVARDTWPDEQKKWSNFRHVEVTPIVGTAEQRRDALRRAFNFSASVFTLNYENLPWIEEELKVMGKPWPFAKLVLDESTKVKSWRGSIRRKKNGEESLRVAGSIRARSLARIAHTKVSRIIELTGTPSPNGLLDLWGQLWFLDAGQRLGRTFSAFQERWFRSVPGAQHDGRRYMVEPMPFAQEQIQDRIRDICLSIDPRDYFDLHEPIRVPVFVELPAKARAQYREMERELYFEIEDKSVEALNAAAKSMKCLQICNGAAYVDEAGNWIELHDEKLQALESIVEESGGRPMIVVYQFKSDLARLRRTFPAGRHLDDPNALRDFKAGRVPLLFLHPASAGHGLDGMQEACERIVFFGHWWNMEERMQVIERIGPTRQMQAGLDRPMYIFDIIVRDSVDEVVIARHETKRGVQDLLLDFLKRRKI